MRDRPAKPQRGFMLDIARKPFTAAWIEDRVRELGDLKFNELGLHFSDDQGFRIASDTHPEIVSSDHLTKAEVRGIVALAASRHITVVPEIDSPVTSARSSPPTPTSSCATRRARRPAGPSTSPSPASAKIVDDLLGEYADLFPGASWHLGGDEYRALTVVQPGDLLPPARRRGHRRSTASGAGVSDLATGWLNDRAATVRAHGRTAVRAWNDGFYQSSSVQPGKNIQVAYWTGKEIGARQPAEYLSAGRKVVNYNDEYLYYVLGQPNTFVYPTGERIYKQWTPAGAARHYGRLLGVRRADPRRGLRRLVRPRRTADTEPGGRRDTDAAAGDRAEAVGPPRPAAPVLDRLQEAGGKVGLKRGGRTGPVRHRFRTTSTCIRLSVGRGPGEGRRPLSRPRGIRMLCKRCKLSTAASPEGLCWDCADAAGPCPGARSCPAGALSATAPPARRPAARTGLAAFAGRTRQGRRRDCSAWSSPPTSSPVYAGLTMYDVMGSLADDGLGVGGYNAVLRRADHADTLYAAAGVRADGDLRRDGRRLPRLVPARAGQRRGVRPVRAQHEARLGGLGLVRADRLACGSRAGSCWTSGTRAAPPEPAPRTHSSTPGGRCGSSRSSPTVSGTPRTTRADTAEEIQDATGQVLFSDAVDLVAAVLAILVVLRLTRMQHEKALQGPASVGV